MENYPPPPPSNSKIHKEKSASVPVPGWTIVDSQDDFTWPCQRSLHAGAVWKNCFIVFGGYDGRHRVNDMYSFNFNTSIWEQLQYPNVPSPRDRHVAVVFEDCLYVFGGFDGAARINDLHEFNLELREWRQVPIRSGLPPSARHSHAAVVYHTSMFIFGGYDGAYRNDFHEFNFVTRTWGLVHSSGDIPRARYRGTCVVSNDNMILHGGHDGSQHLQDTHIFDFNTSTWSTLLCDGPVPSPRDSHIAVMHKKSMYVYGGSTGLAMDDFYELKLEFRSCWRTVDYHADHALTSHTFGGGGSSSSSSLKSPGRSSITNVSDPYRSPARGNGSTSHTPNSVSLIHNNSASGGTAANLNESDENGLITPGPRFCHVGVVYDNSLYIFGGYDGVQRLNDFLKYPFERNNIGILAPPSSLISDLKKYVDNDMLSDVKFIVEDRPIHAHKILCLRSPYFHSLLTGEYMESRASEIVIPEVKHSVFLLLLEYIYTDEVEFSLEESMDLFQAADRFGVERLKSICEQKMLDAIDIESVAHTLTMADERNADNLRERCILFILKHFDQVSKTQAFELMGHSNITLVFEILKRR